jgi:hypothetical protein
MNKLLFTILFLVAFLERIVYDLGPNIELVTTGLLLSSAYLGRNNALILILLIMFATDRILGNTNILIFTWSGFIIPALFTSKIMKAKLTPPIKILKGTLTGITVTSFFFIWTNFGVWLLSGMYEKTFPGLMQSYINALPFFRMNLISTLIFVPLGFVCIESLLHINKKWQLEDRLKHLFRFSLLAA